MKKEVKKKQALRQSNKPKRKFRVFILTILVSISLVTLFTAYHFALEKKSSGFFKEWLSFYKHLLNIRIKDMTHTVNKKLNTNREIQFHFYKTLPSIEAGSLTMKETDSTEELVSIFDENKLQSAFNAEFKNLKRGG